MAIVTGGSQGIDICLIHLARPQGKFFGIAKQGQFRTVERLFRPSGEHGRLNRIGAGVVADQMPGIGPVIGQ